VKKSRKQKRSPDYRWLVGAVVAVAVIAVVGFKVATARSAASAVPLPTEPAAPATATMAREFTVSTPPPAPSATAPAASTGAVAQDDPFPSSPGEQVDWALRRNKPAMVLFHSTNCKPCKLMDELVKKVRADYEPNLVFVDVITNDQANMALIQAAQIRLIPTSFFIQRSGGSKRVVGAMKEEAFRAELANLLAAE